MDRAVPVDRREARRVASKKLQLTPMFISGGSSVTGLKSQFDLIRSLRMDVTVSALGPDDG